MTNNSTDTPRTDDYYAGKGCQCHAHDQSECGCGWVDWTDERIYELQAEVERLRNGMQGSCYCCEPVGEMNQKLEAEVERLKASVQHYQDQALHFQHAWEKVQAMYNKLIYTSTKPIEPQQDDK